MCPRELEHRRNYVDNLLRNLAYKASSMWVVCCIWQSPITIQLEHREGFFPEYTEAKMFSEMLEEKYKKLGLLHEVYLFPTAE